MTIFIGLLLIFWGIFVLYSSTFRLKKGDYHDTGPIGVSGYIEFEFLFKFLNRFPANVMKGFTFFIGIALVTFGTIIIV
ncbi:hypothetical protein [Metabacillus malikii]|uniref:Uncharacterized membrane protein HdeD (DUF308 family) n=1 Tax=Metabacillus malikii TaxID=1504265 RepID=A0ABT9ZQ31_9BACI|nr:hypothetical protein [Metabacillus malikii]MDQ0233345.1 uncharacterized membrane protein HdeD (DUF308 family) [Metabacillus malikii]